MSNMEDMQVDVHKCVCFTYAPKEDILWGAENKQRSASDLFLKSEINFAYPSSP